jgi:hypothetical protein
MFRCKAARIVSPCGTRLRSLVVRPEFEPGTGTSRIQANQKLLKHDAMSIAQGLIKGGMMYCHMASDVSACLLDSLSSFGHRIVALPHSH